MNKLTIALLLIAVMIMIVNAVRVYTMQQTSNQKNSLNDPNSNNTVTIEPSGSIPAVDNTPQTYAPTNKIYSCSSNSDCQLIITNCCSSNAGASWECLNKNSYIDCSSKQTLCLQVLSPQPNLNCVCQNSKCISK